MDHHECDSFAIKNQLQRRLDLIDKRKRTLLTKNCINYLQQVALFVDCELLVVFQTLNRKAVLKKTLENRVYPR